MWKWALVSSPACRTESPTSRIGRVHVHLRSPIAAVSHVHQPRPAAHLAVLHVLLIFAATRIERDLIRLSAMRAVNDRLRVRPPVAEGELRLDFVVGPVFRLFKVNHGVKVARRMRTGRELS